MVGLGCPLALGKMIMLISFLKTFLITFDQVFENIWSSFLITCMWVWHCPPPAQPHPCSSANGKAFYNNDVIDINACAEQGGSIFNCHRQSWSCCHHDRHHLHRHLHCLHHCHRHGEPACSRYKSAHDHYHLQPHHHLHVVDIRGNIDIKTSKLLLHLLCVDLKSNHPSERLFIDMVQI